MKQKTGRRLLSFLLSLALMMGLMQGMSLTAKAETTQYKLWVGGTRVTSDNASDIPAKIPANKKGGTASYNAETKTLTLDNYVYSGDCTGDYINAGGNSYNAHTVIFVGDRDVVNTIIIKGNVSLIQSNASSSPYGLTYLVSDSNLTIKGEGENPKLTVSSGNSNGSGGGASNGIYIYGSHLHIKDCAVEATGGNSNTDSSGIFASKITLENSTLTARCNNTLSGQNAKGYGIRIWNSGKLSIDNKSTVTVIGSTKAVNGGTVVNSGAGTGWDNVNMSGDGTPIGVSETGAAYEFKAMQFLPPPHTHSFSYSASGATITATCSSDGCGLTDKKATLTIVSPTRATYGGTGDAAATLTGLTNFNTATNKTVAVGDIKYAGRDGTTYSESTTAPTDAGKYTAKITVEGKTASVDYEIAKASETAPHSDTTQLNINYTAETISAKDGYEVAGDGSGTSITDFSTILDNATPTVYVRKAASDANHNPSDWVAVTLVSRPFAPTAPATENATNDSTADGKIKGALATWEYKNKGTGKEPTNWTTMTAGDVTVKSGTYQIRVKATDSAPHGKVTEVTVGSKYVALTEANKPTISVSDSHNPPVVGDTLTASTTATDIVYEWYRDGVKISSATESTYTLTADDVGKAITVKVTQTKQANGTSYTNGSEPTQTSDATAAVAKKSSPAAPADASTTGFTPNYPAETFTVGDGYEVSSTNGDTVTAISSLTDVIDGTGKIYIRVKETADTKAGAWLEVTLPSRPGAPTGLTIENATNGSTVDGKIKGTSALMEYKLKGSTNGWTDATATETDVKPGTYSVRVKATASAPHGKATEATVGSNYKALDDYTPVIIKKGESELSGVPVVDDVLTVSCEASGVTYQWYRGYEAISEASGTSYTVTKKDVGKAIKVVATQTKDSNGQEITGTKPTKDSAATSAVVKKTPETLSTDDAKTKAGINYQTEQAAPDSGYEVSTDGTNKTESPISLTGIIDSESPKIYVRTAENDDTAAGAWVEVTIVARPDEPTGLTTESANTATSQDGKIKGTTEDMEYKLKGSEGAWTTATAGETLVASGTYLIRTKASSDKPAGKTAEVAVGSKEIILTDAQKPTAKTNLVFTGSKQALVNEPAESLPEGAKEIQYALGTKDAATQPYTTSIPTATNAGTYYVWYKVIGDENHSDFTADKAVLVEIKADTTAPTGEISIDTNKWTSFLSTITFGLFFKETKEVTITAEDDLTGVQKIEYYVSDQAISLEQVKAVTEWKTYESTFKLNPEKKYVVYARLTDKAGNITYLSSDGLVFVNLPVGYVTDIDMDSAKLNMKLSDSVRSEIKAAGFEYKKKADADTAWTKVAADSVTETVTKEITSLTAGTDYVFRPYVTYTNDSTDTGAEQNFTTDTKPAVTGSIDVEVKNDTDEKKDVVVTIEEGNNVLASQEYNGIEKNAEVTTGKFKELPDGTYNIVIKSKDGEFVETKMITIANGAAETISFTISKGEMKTYVEVEGDTPKVAVDGLSKEELVQSGTISAEEKAKVENGEISLDVPLKVEKKEESAYQTVEEKKAVEEIKSQMANASTKLVVDMFLDLSLFKTVTQLTGDQAGKTDKTDIGSTNTKVLEIAVPYDTTIKGLVVYRYHGSVATALKKLSSAPAKGAAHEDGTFYLSDKYIHIFASGFSTYAIAKAEESSSGGSGGGGGTTPVTPGKTTPAKPAAPTLDSKTDTSITVKTVAGQEYSRDGGKTWQTSGTFTGLTPETEYSIVTKIAATSTANESPVSDALKVTTDKKADSSTPTPGSTTTPTDKPTETPGSTTAPTDKPTETPGATDTPSTTTTPGATSAPADKVTKTEKAKTKLSLNAGLKVSCVGKKVTVKWGKVSKADRYVVYAAYCGPDKCTKIKALSGSKTSMTFTKLNGSKLNLKKNVKVYVIAYRKVNGKETKLAKSITAHVVGTKNEKYTNVKKIKLSKSSYTLKVNKTATVKAEIVLEDKKKKQLSDGHAPEFRYASSNTKVATVDANGRIKAVGKGTCYIYVYAKNGYAKKIKIVVK